MKVVFPEVGPEGLGDVEFGVGRLPQQEVAQAVLAAGADQQVRVGHIGGIEAAGEAGRRRFLRA